MAFGAHLVYDTLHGSNLVFLILQVLQAAVAVSVDAVEVEVEVEAEVLPEVLSEADAAEVCK